MQFIIHPSRVLASVNTLLNALGQKIAIACMALMVCCILLQVVFRYVFNNALPWPDEAARFLMLWMTGVVAPTALRRGGFVAIDMLRLALPKLIAGLLGLFLLTIGLLVLVIAAQLGWSEVTGFGGRFATAALQIPLAPTGLCEAGFAGLKGVGESIWCKVPRSWMMASLLVGSWMMISVTVELILREIAILGGLGDALPIIPDTDAVGAE